MAWASGPGTVASLAAWARGGTSACRACSTQWVRGSLNALFKLNFLTCRFNREMRMRTTNFGRKKRIFVHVLIYGTIVFLIIKLRLDS